MQLPKVDEGLLFRVGLDEALYKMEKKKLRSWLKSAGLIFLLSLAVSACKPTNDVVSDGIFQPRKYRKGIHVDIRSPFKKASEKLAIADEQVEEVSIEPVSETASTERKAFNADISKITESLPLTFKKPLEPKSAAKHQNLKFRSVGLNAEMVSMLAQMQNRSGSKDPEEGEGARVVLTQLGKVFAGLSVLTGVGALIFFILIAFSVGPFTLFTSGLVFMLLLLAAASIVFIGLSLLFSYIVTEKYGDEEAMGWTLVASYILEAGLLIFTYILYLVSW